MVVKDYANEEVHVGDTVQFWDGVVREKKRVVYGHVRELCKDDHVIVDLFQRLDNGQTRLTMPAKDVLVRQPIVA
jgi:hypothetical protein